MTTTDIAIVLDRSGSMEPRRYDHEGGLRSFVREQRALAGEVYLTFVRFDSVSPFEMVYDRLPLEQVDDAALTLVPRGGTPLLQALSQTMAHLEERFAQNPPGAVILMVITDGQENASGPEYTQALVKARIQDWQAKGRIVLYLGANVDEFSEAAQIGIPLANAMAYAVSAGGTRSMYRTLSDNTLAYRHQVQVGPQTNQAAGTMAFTDEQRTQANS